MSDYWTENNLVKPQSIIVCAANYNEEFDFLIVGPRHFDKAMKNQMRNLPFRQSGKSYKWKQGFIDQFGDFYDRIEAMKIVKASGQPFDSVLNGGAGKELFSEGLY